MFIPGDVPAQAKTETPKRKIQKFQKNSLRKKLSSEDFIEIGNAILQISILVTLIIVVAIYAHFKVQNELLADEQAKAIEKLVAYNTGNCNARGKLRRFCISYAAYGPNNVLLDKTDFS